VAEKMWDRKAHGWGCGRMARVVMDLSTIHTILLHWFFWMGARYLRKKECDEINTRR
jgi:hypothetical protein